MTACDFPSGSGLIAQLGQAYYHESYEAPLRRTDLKMHEVYVAIFGHLPWWARMLIIVRNSIVSVFGLHAEPAARVWRPERKGSYAPGDRIVRFNLYSQDDNEIIAGRDDKHLDFRVSVLKVSEGRVVVSTLIFVHNVFGKAYLFAVLPFHKLGMRRLLSQAVTRGRL